MIPSVGSGLTTTPTRQQQLQQRGGFGMATTCKPQLVPSSPAAAAAADKNNGGDMTDSEALRRASQVRESGAGPSLGVGRAGVSVLQTVQGSAKERSLGCVKRAPAARGGEKHATQRPFFSRSLYTPLRLASLSDQN